MMLHKIGAGTNVCERCGEYEKYLGPYCPGMVVPTIAMLDALHNHNVLTTPPSPDYFTSDTGDSASSTSFDSSPSDSFSGGGGDFGGGGSTSDF